jgi:hypothetical protein
MLLLALATTRRAVASEDPRTLILAAITNGQPRVIIPPGIYRMGPDQETGIVLRIHDAHDIEIVANGVTLICTKRVRALMFDHCRNITLHGLTIDYDPLTFTQGKVIGIGADKSWMDIRLDAGYPQVLNDRIVICDPKTRFHKFGINHTWGTKASWSAPGIVRITLKGVAQNVDMHDPVALSGGADGGPVHAITIERQSSNIRLSDVTLHCAPGMGIIESGSDVGMQLIGCKIIPGPRPPGATEDRLLSTSWDGIQCQPARVGARVEDCVIERCGDDSWSVTSESFRVIAREGPILAISPPVHSVRIGDRLMTREGNAAVVRSIRVPWRENKAACEVTLDHELDVAASQWLYDPDYRSRGFIYRNNRIYSHGRGALVKVSDGLIEGNLFRGCDKAIVINPETDSDAAPCDNLIIRNNIIQETGYHQAMPWSDQAGAVCLSHGIRLPIMFHNILIEGNTFDSVKGLNLLISSAQNVTVKDNRFLNTHFTDPGRHNGADRNIDASAVIMVSQSDGVTFAGNAIEKMGPFATHAVVTGPAAMNVQGLDTGIRVVPDK